MLKTYIYSWKETGLVENSSVRLNLIIAYDLNLLEDEGNGFYENNKRIEDLVDNDLLYWEPVIHSENDYLVN